MRQLIFEVMLVGHCRDRLQVIAMDSYMIAINVKRTGGFMSNIERSTFNLFT